MALFSFLRHLWLTSKYRGGLNYALLRNGEVVKLTKCPAYWGDDEWQTPFGTVQTREIKELGDKHDAYGG